MSSTGGEFDSELHRTALAQLDRVAAKLELEADVHERLRHPRRALVVAVPVRMDDGRTEVFTGYRVHHNTVLGPTKGGLRYHAGRQPRRGHRAGDADELEVRAHGPALRRRQGRGALRPAVHVAAPSSNSLTRRYTAEIILSSAPTSTSPRPTSAPTSRPWPG